jgi:hypothetical protein
VLRAECTRTKMATPVIEPGHGRLTVWPQEDHLRLLQLLQVSSIAPMAVACTAMLQQLRPSIAVLRNVKSDPIGCAQRLEAQQALAGLEIAAAQNRQASGSMGITPLAWQPAWERLQSLEVAMHTEMRYVYGPDWEVKPGKLVSKKGTWLKPNCRFSWELTEGQKLYLPQGVVMPVLQIGAVSDPEELKRHEWVPQHLRVWMKPPIVRAVENRVGVWFIYWPHFEDKGKVVVAAADTWLKRTTQMSGDLQTFELIYVPKGLSVRLSSEPSNVEEEWEKYRHQHVHLHRRVVLAEPPLTMKQDQYDIFVGQGEDRLHALLR